MRYTHLVIEREYGSGGTEIARLLSKACNVACYGREIPEMVAKHLNIPVTDIDRYEENATGSLLYSLFMMGRIVSGSTDLVTREGHLDLSSREAIRRLAAQKRSIFVGHGAWEALKDDPRVLRVFIHASEENKARRIRETYGVAPADITEVSHRFDKRRANYFNACTGKQWRNAENYDLILDSGRLGIDGCVTCLQSLFGSC